MPVLHGHSLPPVSKRRIEAFRGSGRRLPIHPAERGLLAVLIVHLCFLPWALGTMHIWSQAISLGLALVGFGLAILPRDYNEPYNGAEPPFRLRPLLKLIRFPIFWIGLVLLLYVGVQEFNPSWRYAQFMDRWWLVRIEDVKWLPTSVDVPLARFSAWRALVIYASAWFLACSVWVGLTRRRSLRILLSGIAVNALGIGIVLSLQHAFDDRRFPWPLTEDTDRPLTGSFIYSNHAGAYLALAAFAAVALASWFYDHGRRNFLKSTPAGVWMLAAFFLATAVLFSLSRGATLTLSMALVVSGGWFLLRRRLLPQAGASHRVVSVVIALIFLLFAANLVSYLDFTAIYSRFDALAMKQTGEPGVRERIMVHSAASGMLRDHWVRGVGAGGFRHLFPGYVRRFPEIYEGGNLFWQHAHCDWLEIPIELGLTGDILLLAGAGWWIWHFVRNRVLWNPIAVPLLLGCGQTLLHATFDFPFQCPAILATWCVLLTVAGRFAEEGRGDVTS